jgi:hypothetical protein
MANRCDAARAGLVLLFLTVAGCSSDVEIIGRCTLEGDPVLRAHRVSLSSESGCLCL